MMRLYFYFDIEHNVHNYHGQDEQFFVVCRISISNQRIVLGNLFLGTEHAMEYQTLQKSLGNSLYCELRMLVECAPHPNHHQVSYL